MTGILTRETVERIVGPVDMGMVSELIESGVTPEDLVVAQAWRAEQDPLAGRPASLPPGRAAAAVEILDKIAEDDDPLAGPAEPVVSPE